MLILITTMNHVETLVPTLMEHLLNKYCYISAAISVNIVDRIDLNK
jgi:hypothetical protein